MACGQGGGAELIEHLRSALADFVGPGWEQEDDVTFVTLERSEESSESANQQTEDRAANDATRNTQFARTQFVPPRRLHHPQRAGQRARGDGAGRGGRGGAGPAGRAAGAAQDRGGRGDDERHGARQPLRPEKPVAIQVRADADELIVSITDHGGGQPIPEADAPDLEAKLAGLQSPRGWGLFLIRSMVDDMRVTADERATPSNW